MFYVLRFFPFEREESFLNLYLLYFIKLDILGFQTGRVLWVGKERKVKTLDKFFKGMPEAIELTLKLLLWICGIQKMVSRGCHSV